MEIQLNESDLWLLIAVLAYVEKLPPFDAETAAIQKAVEGLRPVRSVMLSAFMAEQAKVERD